jgi:tetratricopeptide (TPR) repeat protein
MRVRKDLERVDVYSTAQLWSLLRLLPDDIDALARFGKMGGSVSNTDDNLLVELSSPWTLYSPPSKTSWASSSVFKTGILPLLEASPEPADPEFVGELAMAYLRRNMLEVSETLMERAPEAAHTIVARALIAHANGELDAAGLLEHFDTALEEQPNAHELRILRANARLSVQPLELALEDADFALRQEPEDPRALETRTIALVGLGRLEEAQTALSRLHPSEYSAGRPRLWLLAGQLALMSGDPKRATAELERYVEAIPEETEGWTLLSTAYDQVGEHRSALRARRNCGRVFYLGGVDARQRGDSAQAADLFEWALKFDPGYEPADQALGELRDAAMASGGSSGR